MSKKGHRPKHAAGGRRAPSHSGDPSAQHAEVFVAGGNKGDRRPRRPSHGVPRPRPDVALIYGFHAVLAALRSPRRIPIRMFATEAAAARLAAETSAKGLVPELMTSEDIAARLAPDAVHQGVLLEARPIEPIDISELPATGLVIALDQVTDPHNVGAIIRTAAAFGADAIVTTERHAPHLTGVLAKSASGGLEHVAVASVTNLARALAELGEADYLRVGLDSDGSTALASMPLRRPLALVLGAEGKGLRRLTRERCDVVARLELPGPIKSLNVSNACAVALAIVHFALGSEARGQ